MEKMKAIVQGRYGSSEVLRLREINRPPIDDDEVLLRVQAASVNPLDWHIMRGSPFVVRMASGVRRPNIGIRGVDVAGTVEAVGNNVPQFEPGDEVFGWCEGAFAEYAKAPGDHFVKTPANLTQEQAAAAPVAGFTALQGLRDKGRIQAGHHVLVVGASGGVGTFAVQIAKSFGAEVTGVCSTRNVDLVLSIGADHVIDYTQEDVMAAGRKFDLIFQLAGTKSASGYRRILAPTGTVVLSSGEGRMAGIGRIIGALARSPFVSQNLTTFVAKSNPADLVVLSDLLESGRITSVIDRSFELSDTAEAIRYLEAGHTQGKVIITM